MICYELCEKAVECSACHKLFCFEHTKNFNNTCPNCRKKPFIHKENIPIQKLIADLKI